MAAGNNRERGRVVLELSGLRRSLGDGDARVEVLKGLDLVIRQGEFCSIVGPSGSGKSTLMYLLGALDRPTAGSVKIDGQDVSALGDVALADLRNRKLGFVFQFHYLLPEFSALENVMMPMLKLGTLIHDARDRARNLLSGLGLGDKTHRVPSKLSGGEQQRVAIARALANEPLVVLGDEPSGNLDTANADKVFAEFERLVKDEHQTIVVVTHDLDMAARTDRIIRLVDGQIVDDGPMQRVLEHMREQDAALSVRSHE